MLDPKGLAGILLTNGLVGGRTLLQGVRRLGHGNLLHARRGQEPRELAQYRPAVSDRYFGASFEENFERMEQTLATCFERHVRPDQSYGLILSGGLDSRLVAGVARERNVAMSAFSFGSPRDIEVKCASAVAKALDLRHCLLNINMQRYVEYAEEECKWKHLANGFTGVLFHEPIPDAGAMPGGMLSGYTMETIVGADHSSAAGPTPDQMSFENLFRRVNRWGIPADSLKRLLAKSFSPTIVDDLLNELRQTYHNYAPLAFHKPWLFDQFHRERYHTSFVLGLHGRWPWPVIPYMDSEMMDLMGGMPYAHIELRRMQFHLLKHRFPRLARIPLDRNTFYMKPVSPRHGRVVDHAWFKSRELFYRWTQRLVERRFYHRTMSFDSPGWNAIRAAAEANRKGALQLLDATTLAELLPPPGAPVAVRDGIMDTSKMKLLTGFLLWSRPLRVGLAALQPFTLPAARRLRALHPDREALNRRAAKRRLRPLTLSAITHDDPHLPLVGHGERVLEQREPVALVFLVLFEGREGIYMQDQFPGHPVRAVVIDHDRPGNAHVICHDF